jgi:hypothetical protein
MLEQKTLFPKRSITTDGGGIIEVNVLSEFVDDLRRNLHGEVVTFRARCKGIESDIIGIYKERCHPGGYSILRYDMIRRLDGVHLSGHNLYWITFDKRLDLPVHCDEVFFDGNIGVIWTSEGFLVGVCSKWIMDAPLFYVTKRGMEMFPLVTYLAAHPEINVDLSHGCMGYRILASAFNEGER